MNDAQKQSAAQAFYRKLWDGLVRAGLVKKGEVEQAPNPQSIDPEEMERCAHESLEISSQVERSRK